jgi:DNA-binding HxlR family transcriptional regulator
MVSAGGVCPKPLESVSSYLSKRWTISIIITIANFERLRFNELQEKLGGINAKTLTDRLKELAKEGIVQRESFPEIPPRVEYSLTEKGKQLRDSLLPLVVWANRCGTGKTP